MTRQQLDLLIEYINIKARIAAGEASHQRVSGHSYDRLPRIIGELEDSVEEDE